MTTWMTPYLQFPGTAREAMTFYHSVFGGHLDLLTGAEFGVPDAGEAIMHAHLATEDGWSVLASDCEDTGGTGDGDPSRSLCIGSDVPTPAALEWFEALAAEGGEVLMPWRSRRGARCMGRSATASASGGCSISRRGNGGGVTVDTPKGT